MPGPGPLVWPREANWYLPRPGLFPVFRFNDVTKIPLQYEPQNNQFLFTLFPPAPFSPATSTCILGSIAL